MSYWTRPTPGLSAADRERLVRAALAGRLLIAVATWEAVRARALPLAEIESVRAEAARLRRQDRPGFLAP